MLQLLKKGVRSTLYAIKGEPVHEIGEFAQRIKHRHSTFWKSADAELVRNTSMSRGDSLEQWCDAAHWQRKLSNKYNARLFAEMLNCRVPDLYWKGRNLNDLDFTELPKQYVIRPTIGHSCNMVFLMNNTFNLMDKNFYSEVELKELLNQALLKNPHQEFLFEEFVRSESGEYKIQNDYKISIFNGELAVIDVINRTSPKTGLSSCYDENWNRVDTMSAYYEEAPTQEPPECLSEMIGFAKKLSKAYQIFVRIDFYATDKGAVFGEFTPTPGRGEGFTPDADKKLLQYWEKFCPGMI